MSIAPSHRGWQHLLVYASDPDSDHVGNAGSVDDLCGGIDAAHQIGATRADIVVRRIIEGQEGKFQGLLLGHGLLEMLAHRVAGILSAGPDRVIVRLFVAPAGRRI